MAPPIEANSYRYRKPDGFILSEREIYTSPITMLRPLSVLEGRAKCCPPVRKSFSTPSQDAALETLRSHKSMAFGGDTSFRPALEEPAANKRVPLTGGAATVLTAVTNVDVANSHRNLITDGENLYWQDVDSVRKMPIRGGAVTVLDQARPNTPTAGLALQDANIVYASVADIRFVPTSGTTTPPSARTIVTASERVTALHAVLTFVYWGEQGGAVRARTSGSAPNDLPSASGFVPTSISTSVRGGVFAQAWTQCGSQACKLHFDIPSGESSMYDIDADADSASLSMIPVSSSGETLPVFIGTSRFDMMRALAIRKKAESP